MSNDLIDKELFLSNNIELFFAFPNWMCGDIFVILQLAESLETESYFIHIIYPK